MTDQPVPLIKRPDATEIASVLLEHHRDNIKGCRCGWGMDGSKLGHSHAEHVAEEVLALLPTEVEVEGSFFAVDDLPDILARHMRALGEAGRREKQHWLDEREQQHARSEDGELAKSAQVAGSACGLSLDACTEMLRAGWTLRVQQYTAPQWEHPGPSARVLLGPQALGSIQQDILDRIERARTGERAPAITVDPDWAQKRRGAQQASESGQ